MHSTPTLWSYFLDHDETIHPLSQGIHLIKEKKKKKKKKKEEEEEDKEEQSSLVKGLKEMGGGGGGGEEGEHVPFAARR